MVQLSSRQDGGYVHIMKSEGTWKSEMNQEVVVEGNRKEGRRYCKYLPGEPGRQWRRLEFLSRQQNNLLQIC